MRKFIIVAEMRDLEKQVSLGEISYSRMVEMLNEKAEKWHQDLLKEKVDLLCEEVNNKKFKRRNGN